jgi:hypothetical protein
MPIFTYTKTTTTVTTVTTMSLEVPEALLAPVETFAVAKPNLHETAVPKLMPQSRSVGHARRTKPKSALAKLEAKELSQARAERRFADHRRRDSAERMKQLRAGAVCFD